MTTRPIGGIYDDPPPEPRPPWWRPIARRRWHRKRMALNLIVLEWWERIRRDDAPTP